MQDDSIDVLICGAGAAGLALAILWKKTTGEADVPFGPSLGMAFVACLLVYPSGILVAV